MIDAEDADEMNRLLAAHRINMRDMCWILARCGVSADAAVKAFTELAKIAAKVPFPEGEELRFVRLRAWRRDYGILRFIYPSFYRHALGRMD